MGCDYLVLDTRKKEEIKQKKKKEKEKKGVTKFKITYSELYTYN